MQIIKIDSELGAASDGDSLPILATGNENISYVTCCDFFCAVQGNYFALRRAARR